MSGLPLFDYAASVAAKEAGMHQAAANKASLLAVARQVAIEVAQRKGTVNMDDVQFELHRRGISIRALGNAAGSVFTDKTRWQFTGEYVKSSRVHAHGNLIRCWRLKCR